MIICTLKPEGNNLGWNYKLVFFELGFRLCKGIEKALESSEGCKDHIPFAKSVTKLHK